MLRRTSFDMRISDYLAKKEIPELELLCPGDPSPCLQVHGQDLVLLVAFMLRDCSPLILRQAGEEAKNPPPPWMVEMARGDGSSKSPMASQPTSRLTKPQLGILSL